MEKNITEDLKAEEEWCELPREGEQRNAEVNVDEDHVADFSEDEEKDSCSEAGRTVDGRCLGEVGTAPGPNTGGGVGLFLELFNFCRDEISSFAAISAPLGDLISKGQPSKIKWGEAQERALRTLPERLLKNGISNLPTNWVEWWSEVFAVYIFMYLCLCCVTTIFLRVIWVSLL